MLHSFLSEELAREHLRAVSSNALHAAQIAREARAHRTGIRAAVGLRLVRLGLKLSGGSTTPSVRDPARA
jgi:hypothetical protein